MGGLTTLCAVSSSDFYKLLLQSLTRRFMIAGDKQEQSRPGPPHLEYLLLIS